MNTAAEGQKATKIVAEAGAAPNTNGLALSADELTSLALQEWSCDIVDVGNDIRQLARDLTHAISPGVLRGNVDSEALIRSRFDEIMVNTYGPKGVIARGHAFRDGKTAKNEPASGLTTTIPLRGKGGVVTEMITVGYRAILDALTGNQESGRTRQAVIGLVKERNRKNNN